MSRPARSRPPKLVARPVEPQVRPAATPEERLERAKLAGAAAAPGSTELRRLVERIAANDRAVLGELMPIDRLTTAGVWDALGEVFGASEDQPGIDAGRVIDATEKAATRIARVAATGARVAVATAAPASLLPLHQVWARMAGEAGAEVAALDDVGPFRADGRAGRYLRWVDAVAAVTDGAALLGTRDGNAAREWLFVLPRPALVVADGPFAEVAWEAGIEVVAVGGLDRAALAIAGARGERCTFVPLRVDRAPLSYAPVLEQIQAQDQSPHPTEL
jgi:hypothetical protein